MTRAARRLRAFAARWCDLRTLERFIDPLLTDWRTEDEEATRAGRRWRRRRLWIEYHLAFARVMAAEEAREIRRTLVDRGRADHHAIRRTVRLAGIGVTTATVILMLPFVGQFGLRSFRSVLYLIPQAIPLAIPVGLMLGTLWGLGWSGVSRRIAAVMLAMAMAASGASLIMIGWVVPAANQAYRAERAGRSPARGLNELTLDELGRRLGAVRAGERGLRESPREQRLLAWTYYSRLSIAVAPTALTIFALAVARRGRHSRWYIGLAGAGAIWGYYLLLYGARGMAIDPYWRLIAAVWLPNVALVLWSLLFLRRAGPAQAA